MIHTREWDRRGHLGLEPVWNQRRTDPYLNSVKHVNKQSSSQRFLPGCTPRIMVKDISSTLNMSRMRLGPYPIPVSHRWELPVLYYPKIMGIYPYHFLVVIDQLLSCIIFNNDYIRILSGLPRWLFSWSYMLCQRLVVTRILQILANVMVNYPYHGKKRIITW